jgi:hypothetical protein
VISRTHSSKLSVSGKADELAAAFGSKELGEEAISLK